MMEIITGGTQGQPISAGTSVPTFCPLCGSGNEMGSKAKALYGYWVCRKCYFGFANRRQFAYFVDTMLWLGVSYGIGTVAGIFMRSIGLAQYAINGIAKVFDYLIFPLFAMKDGLFNGASPGKALMGLQSLDQSSGQPAGWMQSLKRNLVLIIPVVPIIIAFQLCQGYRWGDHWGKTRIIWKKYKDKIPFSSNETGPNKGIYFPWAPVILFILVVLLLLAAIAIPNFIRARQVAMGQ
jgi:hypothetical protein